MKAKPPPAEEHGEKVPLWIISFADMITLLLSFFVMLQTMAHSRDAMMFGIAQDSFRRAMAGLGLPDLLLGRQPITGFDYRKLKYPTEETTPEESQPNARIIDGEDEDIRKSFAEMQKLMEGTSEKSEKLMHTVSTPIRFTSAGDTLDREARDYLSGLASDLKQNLTGQTIRLYVIGMAQETGIDRESWFLAARRAAAVEQYLRLALESELTRGKWSIHSLGAGAGDKWCQRPQGDLPCPPITINVMGQAKDNGRR